MSYIKEYVRRVEEELLPRAKHLLDVYESGRMSAGQRRLGGPWQDITQEEIDALNLEVEIYLEIIEAHKSLHKH